MKLRNKLILSCAALAAVATTAVSTTYAWYTSNEDVVAENVNAASAASADTSLYISAAQTYSEDGVYSALTWSSYAASCTPVLTSGNTAPAFMPTTKSNGKYLRLADRTDTKTDGVITASEIVLGTDENPADFMEYVIRLRTVSGNDADVPVYVSAITLTNTTGVTAQQTTPVIPTKMALAFGGDTGITSLGLYGADFLKACKLEVSTASVTVGQDGSIPDAGTTSRTAGTHTTYDISSFATGADTNIGTANAVEYYNAVTGAKLTAPTKVETKTLANATSSSAFATIPANGVLEVRFCIYLDGWDDYCYDAMTGQTLKFGVSFSTKSSTSVWKEAAISTSTGD